MSSLIPQREFLDKGGYRVSVHAMDQPDDAPEKLYFLMKEGTVLASNLNRTQVARYESENKA